MIIQMIIQKILKKYNSDERINIILLKENLGPSYCRNLGLKILSQNMWLFSIQMIIGQKIN